MVKKFDFGRINYNGTGRRYPVTVRIALEKRGGEDIFTVKNGEKVYTGEKTPEYFEFTASGMIGARCGGQCLDEIAKHCKNSTFMAIYRLWQKYHLNGMHAGTPEQEKALERWKNAGNKYSYDGACEYLKSCGLYEVLYTGKTVGRMYNNEPYKYGHAWIVNDIPADDLQKINNLFEMEA